MASEVSEDVKVQYERIDAKRNEQYKLLIRNPEFPHKELLRDGSRAWIAYRDARCGKLDVALYAGTLAELAKERGLVFLTSSRVVELLYLDTGVNTDRFYRFVSVLVKSFP
ncbi:hypothetical protein D3C76_430820 [compost metagenome]